MDWLIVSEIMDFSSRAGLESIISDNINKSIISDFPLLFVSMTALPRDFPRAVILRQG
jgi:hypothetical protein